RLGVAAELDERPQGHVPLESGAGSAQVLLALLVQVAIVEQACNGLREGVGVLLGHDEPPATALDLGGEHVAVRADERKFGPDETDEPRAVAAPRVEVVEVAARTDVGFEDVLPGAFVQHPAYCEEDGAA